MLRQWCTNGLRSKVEPTKQVAQLIRKRLGSGIEAHFDARLERWSRYLTSTCSRRLARSAAGSVPRSIGSRAPCPSAPMRPLRLGSTPVTS